MKPRERTFPIKPYRVPTAGNWGHLLILPNFWASPRSPGLALGLPGMLLGLPRASRVWLWGFRALLWASLSQGLPCLVPAAGVTLASPELPAQPGSGAPVWFYSRARFRGAPGFSLAFLAWLWA